MVAILSGPQYDNFSRPVCNVSDSKVHGANMGPIWVLSAPDGPHVGLMNPAIRGFSLNVTKTDYSLTHMTVVAHPASFTGTHVLTDHVLTSSFGLTRITQTLIHLCKEYILQ